MSLENINNLIEKPSLQKLQKGVIDTIQEGNNFIEETLPQIEAFCERNQKALQMFCESSKGFGKDFKNHKLTGTSEVHNSIMNS